MPPRISKDSLDGTDSERVKVLSSDDPEQGIKPSDERGDISINLSISNLKEKRDLHREQIKTSLNKGLNKGLNKAEKGLNRADKELPSWGCKCIGNCCGLTVIFSVVMAVGWLVNFIYNYYINTLNKRKEIDTQESVVSEQLIDYISPKVNGSYIHVNCTNNNPCYGWDCNYVIEHFKEDPARCNYDDWLVAITVAIISCFICVCCQACGSSSPPPRKR